MSDDDDTAIVTAPTPTPVSTPGAGVPLLAAAATAAIGAATGRRDLLHGGARLLAIQLAAAGLRAAVKRLDNPAVAAPPPLVVDAMAVWLAETVVGAAFARFEPAAEPDAKGKRAKG